MSGKATYTCFLVFNAGVGIDLVNLILSFVLVFVFAVIFNHQRLFCMESERSVLIQG